MARRIIVIVFGFTLLLIGVIMIVLPGPAIIVIPLGLALLGTEFVWAKRLLEEIRKGGGKTGRAILSAIPIIGKRYKAHPEQTHEPPE
ncbi:MAG: PGPGW domain-containing protein [bacterium]|nr:PGPGW domain-containing protein [bacterium]